METKVQVRKFCIHDIDEEKIKKVERVYSGTLPQWIPRYIYEFKNVPKRG